MLVFWIDRTPFTPQLKILKRPEKNNEEQRIAEQKKGLAAQQPVRTLAQREAAYAEARQRIMGVENHSSESSPKSHDVDSRYEYLVLLGYSNNMDATVPKSFDMLTINNTP